MFTFQSWYRVAPVSPHAVELRKRFYLFPIEMRFCAAMHHEGLSHQYEIYFFHEIQVEKNNNTPFEIKSRGRGDQLQWGEPRCSVVTGTMHCDAPPLLIKMPAAAKLPGRELCSIVWKSTLFDFSIFSISDLTKFIVSQIKFLTDL